ncbi:MAG: hypothetical protein II824_06005 [Bacteroidales bacterium]|nr:hypothetical protein [Bacteroidales bacterium]
MRRLITIITLMAVFVIDTTGQNYPSKWIKFHSDGYIYAIESDMKPSNTSQTSFVNSLLDRARLNVAKQVNLSINDHAKLVKQSLNGITNVVYSSSTTYSTEATMRLLRTDSEYQQANGKGFAIAYLDKSEVCGYWSKEAERILREQENGIAKAEKMIAMGYKEQAKPILEQLVAEYGAMDGPLVWLAICSFPENQYHGLLNRYTVNVRKIDSSLLSLGHGITIFLDYHSDLFGEDYPAALSQLSAKLSSAERSFVDNPLDADWIVKINATSREGQSTIIGSNTAYFAYVDVSTTVIKGSTAQTVFKDTFSIKEGDTRGMKQAAIAAFQGIVPPLYDRIDRIIKE